MEFPQKQHLSFLCSFPRESGIQLYFFVLFLTHPAAGAILFLRRSLENKNPFIQVQDSAVSLGTFTASLSANIAQQLRLAAPLLCFRESGNPVMQVLRFF